MRWQRQLKVYSFLIIDRLFNTHLVERELARQQAEASEINAQLAVVNRHLAALSLESDVYRTALYMVMLQDRSKRSDLDDWLHFAPELDSEEKLLQGLIDCLVKPRLAAVDMDPSPTDPNAYVYRLRPDWQAILTYFESITLTLELYTWLIEQKNRTSRENTGTE